LRLTRTSRRAASATQPRSGAGTRAARARRDPHLSAVPALRRADRTSLTWAFRRLVPTRTTAVCARRRGLRPTQMLIRRRKCLLTWAFERTTGFEPATLTLAIRRPGCGGVSAGTSGLLSWGTCCAECHPARPVESSSWPRVGQPRAHPPRGGDEARDDREVVEHHLAHVRVRVAAHGRCASSNLVSRYPENTSSGMTLAAQVTRVLGHVPGARRAGLGARPSRLLNTSFWRVLGEHGAALGPPRPSGRCTGSVDLYADDGISDARRVADPHGVNLARWCTLCGRVLYARNGTSVTGLRLEGGAVWDTDPRCLRVRTRRS
jgi:hypothetical protein